MPSPFSAFVRNGVSLAGTVIATVTAVLFAVLALLDLAGYLANPYTGLLLFIAVPAVFALGLLLIPLGNWRERRRRRRTPGAPPPDWPVFDLRVRRQRTLAVVVLLLTAVNVVIVSLAAYGSVHYMETDAFCGTVCHTSMEPEYVAHGRGAHANVRCVACHVGPGVGALVESKLAGTRRLWHEVFGEVPTPVPAPGYGMRPSRAICETCHSPSQAHGDTLRVLREFAGDEKNTETVTKLMMHVGGGGSGGIHWHMNPGNEIEFIATDDAGDAIPYVRLTEANGKVREFRTPDASPAALSSHPRRRMDCMDCHNRPAHPNPATPQRAVDGGIAQGRIPRELPFVRREALGAMETPYAGRDEALTAIAERVRKFYASTTTDARLVERAAAGMQDVWTGSVFPAMKVTWGTYRNQLGHVDFPGCFRCHDDSHKAADGSVIRQDCELCHSLPE